MRLVTEDLDLDPEELIIDGFAGGGGASEGIRIATGRDPDFAINHDPAALAMHKANHPRTVHICGDIFDVSPRKLVGNRRVGFAWFSPDCTYHSKARGGKPFRDKKSAKGRRGLAWVAVRVMKETGARVVVLENVEEFEDWGPIGADGRPCPARRGHTFRRLVGQMRALGYDVEWRQLRACDFGAPTTRKRLFLIARNDGKPIVWPEPTHGPGRIPFRTAAECIDWSIPCPSIFGRKKPLAEKTLKRIARGIRKFVLDAAKPFIVPTNHGGDLRVHGIDEPLRTICAGKRGSHAVVAPTLIHSGNGERLGQAPRVYDIEQPLGTVMAEGVKHALVSAFLAKHNGGHEATGSHCAQPMHTLTTQNNKGLAVAHMLKLHGSSIVGQEFDAPAPTIRAQGTHLAEVRAFLTKYNGTGDGQSAQLSLGTITTRDRFGVVMVHGEPYAIVDIGLRMLQPPELFRAQGFRSDYVINLKYEKIDKRGRRIFVPLSKTDQVRMCGNSVSPTIAAEIVRANLSASAERRAA
ncbi:MAG: DNA cytosine methyltransferase [Polyangiaceae bacterium]|nr:DNA cytosine methyltransferase [Polyangiaceae bacterium]